MQRNKVTINIGVPAYFKSELDFIFFKRAIKSIELQTFEDYRIIISAQLKKDLDEIKSWLNEKENKSFKEKIVLCFKKGITSASQNWNTCLDYFSIYESDYCLLLHQDDYLYLRESLQLALNSIENNNWLMISSQNFKYNFIDKRFDDDINGINQDMLNTVYPFYPANFDIFKHHCVSGLNYYGNPSTVLFKNSEIRFDNKLKNLIDLDFMLQLYKKYGKPLTYKKMALIAVTQHNQSISSEITEELQQKEINYMHTKWNN